ALAREGERLGFGRGGPDLNLEPRGVLLERREHPGRDVGRGRSLDQARLQQIEREVAGSRADLECVTERLLGQATQRLAQLAGGLVAPDLSEVDSPLRVVRGRRAVVVALVDLLDSLGASRHGRGCYAGASRLRAVQSGAMEGHPERESLPTGR